MLLLLGIIMPFIGTTLGACMVFLMKKDNNCHVSQFLTAVAGGVMISASMFSLLLPAIELCENIPAFIPTCVGFASGVVFLCLVEWAVRHLQKKSSLAHSFSKKNMMLVFAVTMHNIPEGMAVGAVLAGAFSPNPEVAVPSALMLSLGIAIQNFPEGAIISLPLRDDHIPKWKAFLYGALSGVVEPVFAVLTLLITSFISALLPYLLSFASGAMMYVVVSDLIPDSQSDLSPTVSTLATSLGFVLMMFLDLALG